MGRKCLSNCTSALSFVLGVTLDLSLSLSLYMCETDRVEHLNAEQKLSSSKYVCFYRQLWIFFVVRCFNGGYSGYSASRHAFGHTANQRNRTTDVGREKTKVTLIEEVQNRVSIVRWRLAAYCHVFFVLIFTLIIELFEGFSHC